MGPAGSGRSGSISASTPDLLLHPNLDPAVHSGGICMLSYVFHSPFAFVGPLSVHYRQSHPVGHMGRRLPRSTVCVADTLERELGTQRYPKSDTAGAWASEVD